MSRPSANLRLFVAAYPPPEAAGAMLGRLRGLPLAEHRRTPPEQVHLTLLFIGDTPESEMAGVRESVARSAAGIEPVVLSARRMMTLPRGRFPRLVALETDAPAGLLEIQRRLGARLASGGRHGERFTPHFTLCRFAHQARAADLDQPVALPPFAVTSILLMRSVLRAQGAEHIEVARFELAGQ